MRSYARSQCRRRYLIEYFGQQAPWEYCGTCDQCQKRASAQRGEITITKVDDEELLIVRKVLQDCTNDRACTRKVVCQYSFLPQLDSRDAGGR